MWRHLEVGPLEVIRIRWGHQSEAFLMGLAPLLEEITHSLPSVPMWPQGRVHASTHRDGRDLQTGRGGLRMKPTLPAPWSWMSQLPITFCCVSHLVYAILLSQSKRTKIPSYLNQTNYNFILSINMEERRLVERKIHFLLPQGRYILQWIHYYLLYLPITLFLSTVLRLMVYFHGIHMCKKHSVNAIPIFLFLILDLSPDVNLKCQNNPWGFW